MGVWKITKRSFYGNTIIHHFTTEGKIQEFCVVRGLIKTSVVQILHVWPYSVSWLCRPFRWFGSRLQVTSLFHFGQRLIFQRRVYTSHGFLVSSPTSPHFLRREISKSQIIKVSSWCGYSCYAASWSQLHNAKSWSKLIFPISYLRHVTMSHSQLLHSNH